MFETCSDAPLSAIIELLHEVHGSQWVYDSLPLSEVLETLGHLFQPADAYLELQGVHTADLSMASIQLMGKHWTGRCAAPSRGEQWVRIRTVASESGSATSASCTSMHIVFPRTYKQPRRGCLQNCSFKLRLIAQIRMADENLQPSTSELSRSSIGAANQLKQCQQTS
jgi:hypothetical protein